MTVAFGLSRSTFFYILYALLFLPSLCLKSSIFIWDSIETAHFKTFLSIWFTNTPKIVENSGLLIVWVVRQLRTHFFKKKFYFKFLLNLIELYSLLHKQVAENTAEQKNYRRKCDAILWDLLFKQKPSEKSYLFSFY